MADRVEEIMQRFKKARNKRLTKDPVWTELDLFDRGEQWSQSGEIPAWVPKPVTNYIHLVKTTKRAALAMDNPVGRIRALSPLDISLAEQLQVIYEWLWHHTKARKTVREVIETGKLLGTGIAQVVWNENTGVKGGRMGRYEGDIEIRQIDPASFYPDPTAFCIDDCQYIHIVERKPVSWLKKHPRFGKKMADVEPGTVPSEEMGEIYTRDYQSRPEQKDGMIDFHSHYEKVPNPEGGFNYRVTYVAGTKIVGSINKLEPNCYPFAIYYDFPQRQDFWGKSTCEFVLDNQKLINKVEMIIAMIGTLMQNPQKVVAKNSGIDPKEAAKYGTAPGHTYLSNIDPTRAIHWLSPPQIPPALINLKEMAAQNIREITGITEAYMGQSVGSLQTSQGVNQLIERATMRDRDQMYDVEMFIEQLSRLLIKFMTTKYTEKRFAYIVRGQAESVQKSDFIPFIGTEFDDLEFDFAIDVSAKAPVTRARRQSELQNLLNMQGQYGYSPAVITPQEYIQGSEMVDADKIIKRMNAEQMQNKIQQGLQVATMMMEGLQRGLDPQEVMKMGESMLTQMDQQQNKGIGNAGSFQARQQGLTG